MVSTGAFLAPALQLLTDALPGVNVTGPTVLPLPDQGPLAPTLIAQLVPGSTTQSYGQRECQYTIRCVGYDDAAVLDIWDALYAALTDAETGEPLGAREVIWTDERTTPATQRKHWLFMASIGNPTGPIPDPEANWPVIVAVATMRWAHKEG